MTGNVIPLGIPYPNQDQDKITSYDQSGLWSTTGVGGQRYNPDSLVGRKGLDIYAAMLIDEQVKAVCEFKLSAILARGFQFKFDAESALSEEEQKKRVRVFQTIVKKMRGSFSDALDAIASGREFGFSVTEKVYSTIVVEGQKFVGINQLLTRDPCTFQFFTDDYGTLTSIKQRVARGLDVELDIDRLIHYVHRPKWDQIYGRSDLRAAYRSWYAKDNLIKIWLLFLEKYAGGIAVAKRTDDNAPMANTPEFASLQSALQNMSSLRSLILPRGVDLELLFPGSTNQYEQACVFHDLAIAKALLVPNLLGLSHTGQTGAYSQSQTQFEAFMWTLNSDGDRLEETLNEQLFRDLGDQNWGDDDYPRFAFKPVSLEHAKWLMTTWKDMLGAKAVLATEEDEAFLREMLEFPARDETSILLVDPMEQQRIDIEKTKAENPAPVVGKPEDKPAANEDKFAAAMRVMDELRITLAAMTVEKPQQSTPNITTHVHHHTTPEGSTLPTGGDVDPVELSVNFHGSIFYPQATLFKAARRVAFAVIEKRTTAVEKFSINDLATAIARAVNRSLGDEATMAAFLDNDTSDIAAFAFHPTDMGKMKSACASLLDRAWTIGQEHASSEVQKARSTTLEAEVAKVRFASLRNKAAAYFDTQSFRMAGDTGDAARKIIQQELQNGIKFATPLKDVRANIWDRLASKGVTTQEAIRGVETDEAVNNILDTLWVDTEEMAAAYLATMVRTNTFEALNEARYAEFTDPEVADFVQGLQYASVMDESTTVICEHLDDAIYKADSPVWDTYRPPNHFNCRSILIPVTTLDDWDGQESEYPDVEPQEGFK